MDQFLSLLFTAAAALGGVWLTANGEGAAVEAWIDGQTIVTATPADPTAPSERLAGRLVHLRGQATTDADVTLPHTGLTAQGVLRLEQTVEMYQWVERRSSKDDKQTHYHRSWRRDRVASEWFDDRGYINPPLAIASAAASAPHAMVGRYRLDRSAIDRMDWFAPLDLCGGAEAAAEVESAGYRCASPYLFLGTGTIDRPQIGDLRIKIRQIGPGPVTVIGRQTGAGAAAAIDRWPMSGRDGLLEVRQDHLDLEAMRALRAGDATFDRWAWMAGGVGAAWIGATLFVVQAQTLWPGSGVDLMARTIGELGAALVLVPTVVLSGAGLAWREVDPAHGLALFGLAAAGAVIALVLLL